MAVPQLGDIQTDVEGSLYFHNLLLNFSVGKMPSKLQTWLLVWQWVDKDVLIGIPGEFLYQFKNCLK